MPTPDPLTLTHAYLDYLRERKAFWFTRAYASSRQADPESHARYAVVSEVVDDLTAILAGDGSRAIVHDLANAVTTRP